MCIRDRVSTQSTWGVKIKQVHKSFMTTPVFTKVHIGADHAGYDLKEEIKKYLETKKITVVDHGPASGEKCDYPDYADKVAREVQKNEPETCGILVCGSGQGMCIAANKFMGVRCGLVRDYYTALCARRNENCNVLAVGQRIVGSEVAKQAVDTFITTSFTEDEAWKKRQDRLTELETKNLKDQVRTGIDSLLLLY
eukprot:TRINITY_DN7912_c0_g1_i1.p1 TRINITY_DN7912_c0_g1~~TRINITY_DN7912_c0_g1_i1.p1  ORF type:complete len:216 (+),score=53.66 TRINITY_DN7912_c0_g1_i1:62-649(+)